jgi:hypothetical protein
MLLNGNGLDMRRLKPSNDKTMGNGCTQNGKARCQKGVQQLVHCPQSALNGSLSPESGKFELLKQVPTQKTGKDWKRGSNKKLQTR